MITEAVLTCPSCGHKKEDLMPIGYAQRAYTCSRCSGFFTASEEECCVFCKYSDRHCPLMQDKRNCCSG